MGGGVELEGVFFARREPFFLHQLHIFICK